MGLEARRLEGETTSLRDEGPCVLPHAYDSTEEVQIIECDGLAPDGARTGEYSRSSIETSPRRLYAIRSRNSSRTLYPGCGAECKTCEGAGTTPHDLKPLNTPLRYVRYRISRF